MPEVCYGCALAMKVGIFLKDAGKYGLTAMGSGLVTLVLAIWTIQTHRVTGVGLCVLATVLFCFGAYKSWSTQHSRAEALTLELNKEIEKRGRPELIMIYEDGLFSVRNISLNAALRVEIDDITKGKWRARFEEIPFIDGKCSSPVRYTVGGENCVIVQKLEKMLSMHAYQTNESRKSFAMTIRYKDASEIRWISDNDFQYNRLTEEGQCFHRRFYKIP